ncbi:hypothetical protein [Spiroplasma alleghenense]|uniref:Transmembrane protein n=1 Tax=Spiroplasma alleghenense TaxID=216931 RepID=A0A345Z4F1_9MOLU|nr:hypothetical protein [Spiroplasma alleghenense]AXK51480.1 hypothetical protein SALLE_v1c08100 [Spiroplasma alleghenense]
MKLTKSLNWIQIFLKSLITILLVIFLLIEALLIKNELIFEISLTVGAVIVLSFIIESAVEFPINRYSSALASIPIALAFWPLIKPKPKNKIKEQTQKNPLEPSVTEKISANRLKISYLIASLTLRALLYLLLIIVLINCKVEIYWVVVFIASLTVSVAIDGILSSRFINILVKNSKSIANRSAVLEA